MKEEVPRIRGGSPRRVWRSVAPAVLLLLAFGALLYWQSPGAAPQVTQLGAGAEPLRDAFNRDADKVRLLLLLDPT